MHKRWDFTSEFMLDKKTYDAMNCYSTVITVQPTTENTEIAEVVMGKLCQEIGAILRKLSCLNAQNTM